MSKGLSIRRIVNVVLNLQPLAASRRDFGGMLLIGSSNVIGGGERVREYMDIDAIAGDFGFASAEYKAAVPFFSQMPKPKKLIIGRWIKEQTAAKLRGATLKADEKAITAWQAVTDGSFKVTIDGVEHEITALDFSAQTDLTGVAQVISDGLTAKSAPALMTWDGERFELSNLTLGQSSTITYLSDQGDGTDISIALKMTPDTGLPPERGYDSETPLEALSALYDISNDWYACDFAEAETLSVNEHLENAQFIEAAEISRVYGVTVTDTRVLDSTYTQDLASKAKELKLRRTVLMYSQNIYAIMSFFGRALTVNFNANRTTITMMFKQAPTIVAESLSNTQANVLADKYCNVFVNYSNDTAIIQKGVVSNGTFFDEVHGLDWLVDAMQNNVYNLLYQSTTKIPQTDEGQTTLMTGVAQACEEGRNNGLIASGIWNADGFGQLSRGDELPLGYYIYAASVYLQDQSEREKRHSQPIQVAVKLAGAIHDVDVLVNVNR